MSDIHLICRFVSILLLAAHIGSCQQCNNKDAKVLILGAGMSGIAAGSKLNSENINDILILEARNVIGGRVQSVDFTGTNFNVELGPYLIHGFDPDQPDSHPLYSITTQCGGILVNLSDTDSLIAYNKFGVVDLTSRLSNYTIASEFVSTLSEELQMNNQSDISYRTGLHIANWSLGSDEDRFVEWFNFDYCLAVSPEESSLFNYENDETYEIFGDPNNVDDYFIADPDGYLKVVKCLANSYLMSNDERLHLNSVVNAINWSDDCVCVTALEAGVNKTYCADYAIVTFSIGVLQSDEGQRMFSPSLPVWKMDAINTMQMVHFFVFYIEFDRKFWPDYEFIGYISNNITYSIPIYNSVNYLNTPILLCAHAVGKAAIRLTKLTNQEILDEILIDLTIIFGNNVSNATRTLRNNYVDNPLFYGSYSNAPLGVTDQTYLNIAAPVGNLYFTGEGTSREFYGYLHGAYYQGLASGNLVAQELIPSVPSYSRNLEAYPIATYLMWLSLIIYFNNYYLSL